MEYYMKMNTDIKPVCHVSKRGSFHVTNVVLTFFSPIQKPVFHDAWSNYPDSKVHLKYRLRDVGHFVASSIYQSAIDIHCVTQHVTEL